MGDTENSNEQLFLRHLGLIENLLRFVARRYALHDDEPDEFAAWVKLKMVEDEYAVLRKFRGEAQLRTYLTTVFVRLAKDWLIARRGKWRPSAHAHRAGLSAVRLEMLISYDGRTMDEAIEVVKRNFGATESRAELRLLAEDLPQHPPRSHVSLECLAEPSSGLAADQRAMEGEQEARSAEISGALADALREMSVSDRLILEMHFGRGMTVASVARVLGVPQRPLYTQVERLLARLRQALEHRGVTVEQVRELFGWAGAEVDVDFGASGQEVSEAARDGETENRAAVKSTRASVQPPGRRGVRRQQP